MSTPPTWKMPLPHAVFRTCPHAAGVYQLSQRTLQYAKLTERPTLCTSPIVHRAARFEAPIGRSTSCRSYVGISKLCTKASGKDLTASTSASAPHIPVLLPEILSLFHDTHIRTYVDGTLGAGGHASAVLANHPEIETLVGFDMDPLAHDLAHKRLSAIASDSTALKLVRSNFRNLSSELRNISPGLETGGVDAMLLDLGVSSMQVDIADRGFSFAADGPIDMRMDPSAVLGAEQIVNSWPEAELANIIFKYGEEKRARNIAQRIIQARPIKTTAELVTAIGGPAGRMVKVKGGQMKRTIHPATRTFQALRIAVNDELAALEQVLPAAIHCLAPKGRLGVISFHSLEDRIVKCAFREAAGKGVSAAPNKYAQWSIPIKEPDPSIKILTKRPIVAGEPERLENPRSRSAKLRFLEKL